MFLYVGPISRHGYECITNLIPSDGEKQEGAALILSTLGGEPDAAYRIARALRYNYERLDVIIPSQCKSAGTLLLIGASRLVVCDRGELGPLDVQVVKHDDAFERNSGLDLIQALSFLQRQALDAFRDNLLELKLGSRASFKLAAELASQLTVGMFSPIYGQIDPVRVGEIQRAVSIAFDYGERLNAYDRNLKDGALKQLVMGYPSHGFVIDRKEARELFNHVDRPDEEEQFLGDQARSFDIRGDGGCPYLYRLAPSNQEEKSDGQESESPGESASTTGEIAEFSSRHGSCPSGSESEGSDAS